MSTKHTPGPWRVTGGSMTKYVEATIRDGWVQEVAAVGPTEADNGYGRQQDANALLIAAAPDLLTALEALMQLESRGRVMPVGKEWDTARAAIAKATGEAS